MELGEKLRQARLEAGLSQRQLCGDEITRNMLSLIENGSAKPSMKTMQYLAGRLGKSVSYFLEETAVLSPNQPVIAAAREFFDAGAFSEAHKALEDYRSPDPVYDREKELLEALTQLELAREAIRQERFIYAQKILEQTHVDTIYLAEELRRKKLLLLGTIPGQRVAAQLPGIDEELLIRACEAFETGEYQRSCHLLDATEDHSSLRWHLLRGQAALHQQQWELASNHLRQAEKAFPKESCPLLEICYRELGDFQKAYEYACKQRK